MPPNTETPDPEKALNDDQLTLEELGQIVAITPGEKDGERDAAEDFKKIHPDRLREEAFFQSPVDKSAWTILKEGKQKGKKRFVFNEFGVLSSRKSAEALLAWLKPKKPDAVKMKKALDAWITKGTPTEGVLFDEIEKGLREAAVRPELLYNQPICRLVRRDQLRYDPNYQALYQITPAQEQLTKMKSEDFKADHDSVKRNQRVYWGISETFQSLVALFDSDLGRGDDDATKNRKTGKITKELIRITVQEKQDGSSKTTSLFPAGLNRYSPLRFWSPPPSFASSVFHMLFWRSIITSKDLFGREVKGETVRKRTESYYVIVNYFNPAKFRIAEYPNLFRAILTIARELVNCSGQEDLALPDTGRTRLFYPRRFPGVEPKFQEFEKLTLSIPFSDNPTPETVWELAKAYKSKQSDPKESLLRFLRDRAIELILWSSYQMEIRSIGLIPIQYLYEIKLTEDLPQFFEDMSARYRESPENFSDINKQVSKKLLEPDFNKKIKLEKVYGGPHRDVFRPEILNRDIWLARHNPKSPPRRASGRVSKVGATLPPAPRRKSK